MWIGLRWQQPAKLRAGFGGLKTAVENLRSLLDLFPWKNTVTATTADSCKSFSLSLSQNSHGVRQSSHVSVETNSNKRISVLGTNHTKIYRVNLVGFKHSAEDPSRSPHHQKQVHFEIEEILKCTFKASRKVS